MLQNRTRKRRSFARYAVARPLEIRGDASFVIVEQLS